MPSPEKTQVRTARGRIFTTMVHGVAPVERVDSGEIVIPVHVHGVLHGLRCSDAIARELMHEIGAALDTRAVTGRQAAKRRSTYAEAAATGEPLLKPGGRVL